MTAPWNSSNTPPLATSVEVKQTALTSSNQLQPALPVQTVANEQKLLVLCDDSRTLTDEYKSLLTEFAYVGVLSDSLSTMDAKDVFARIQCLVIDLSNSDQKVWYQHSIQVIKSLPNMKIIYLGSKGQKINIKSVKDTYKADVVLKYLPSADTIQEFMSKLADHIPSVEKTIFQVIKAYLSSKFSSCT